MSIIDFLISLNNEYSGEIVGFFTWYNSMGRKVLDFFYTVFNSIFNVLLAVAVLVSALYIVMTVYVILRKKNEKKSTVNEEELPFVTVQIPTFNELAAIRCAKACMEFDYPKDKYEIIIGDDSNKVEISRKIKEFASHHSIMKVTKRESNYGYKPGNLNNMLKHSKGEFIVIFDSDFVPEQDFLKKIISPFSDDKKLAAVQARWKIINSNQNIITSLGSTILSVYHHISIPFVYGNREIVFLCGSAEAVRKDTLIKLGGWDDGNLTEDIEFSLRLLERGYKIKYLENLECDCEVPYTLKDLYRQQMRWAYGVIHSSKKHFRSITKSRHIDFKDKFCIYGLYNTGGYLLSVLLAGLFITGTLSFITHPPAPVQWGVFFKDLIRNILLTSGLLIASIAALYKAKKSGLTFKMLASSFSYGLVVTYYVNVGIFKAIAKIPMQWYMLNKKGNKISE